MASLSPTTTLTTTTTTTTITTKSLSSVSLNPLWSKPSQLSAFRSSQTRNTAPKISSIAAKNDDNQTPKTPTVETSKFDRRNMLIGLGGLYGAATTISSGPAAIARPTAPDVTQCRKSEIVDGGKVVQILNCCPPKPSQFVDFKLPNTHYHGLKIRPPAHLVDDKYLAKYWKALSLMKALPDSDPRSFNQLANVHCAYCNGDYNLIGLPDVNYQIHGTWLFYPFHRAYLYFYERILGKLIDDPTFAIPYWNWDHPNGMSMPAMFNIPNSPFFNLKRDQNHFHPKLLDFSYDGSKNEVNNVTYDEQIARNLTIMYRQMVSNGKTASMFLGEPFHIGDTKKGSGSLEYQPHGTIHEWVGDPNNPLHEDMGIFHSSGRDPIFYAHHANVDRLWSIWKTLSPKNKDFKDEDFLNSYFYLYDENAKSVRILVRDCLDTRKMGYDYQPMDIPWMKSRPTPGHGRGQGLGHGDMHKAMFGNVKNAAASETKSTTTVTFPKALKNSIRSNVQRPVKSRTRKEKEDEEEVLIIEVESSRDVYSKFDVYVNDEDEVPTKENRTQTEYAGSFVNVPHKHKHGVEGNVMTTSVKFGLTDLIEDIGADDDEGIDVTFVPRTGTESVVIKDVRIEFLH